MRPSAPCLNRRGSEHSSTLGEQVGESDGDDFAIFRRRLLKVRQEHGQHLSEEPAHDEGQFEAAAPFHQPNSPRLRLHSVKHGDDPVGIESWLLDSSGETDESNEAVGELLRLARLQASKQEHEDGVGHVLPNRVAARRDRSAPLCSSVQKMLHSQRNVFEDGLQQLKAVRVVGLRGDEMLEDSEHRRELVGGDDVRSSPGEESSQQPDEGGHVSFRLPQCRSEEGWQQCLVRLGEVGRLVQLEQLRENLKDEGRELGNVLLQDRLEGREESRFEFGQRGRVARGDEAASLNGSAESSNA